MVQKAPIDKEHTDAERRRMQGTPAIKGGNKEEGLGDEEVIKEGGLVSERCAVEKNEELTRRKRSETYKNSSDDHAKRK